jgi:ketosteroid isomerase-like protein
MNAVLRFVDAVNRGDADGVEASFHADFEMIVPQHPARGFKGRDQEVRNMRYLMTAHPEGRIEVRRIVERGDEVWVQNRYTSDGLEMEAVVIYEIDPVTDTIRAGHYYSERVDRGGPEISAWIEAL